MTETTKDVNFNSSTQKASISDKTKLEMEKDDTLTLDIGTGWSRNGTKSITRIDFFNANIDPNTHVHSKGSLNTTWTPASPSVPTGVSIAILNDGGVKLTDIENTDNAIDDYFYEFQVTDSANTNSPFAVDPELVIRKKKPS